MKALVGAFNQEKALVGAFSVFVQPVVEPMEHYTALVTIQSHRRSVDCVIGIIDIILPTQLHTHSNKY